MGVGLLLIHERTEPTLDARACQEKFRMTVSHDVTCATASASQWNKPSKPSIHHSIFRSPLLIDLPSTI